MDEEPSTKPASMSVILVDDVTHNAWRFEPGTEIWIGRRPERNDIALSDDRVSRRHLSLRFTVEGAEITALPGTSGALLDHENTWPGARASFGSTILVGGHQLFVMPVGWFDPEPPGPLPATPISTEEEFDARLARYVGLADKTPDDALWCSLYLRWRQEAVAHYGDARRLTSYHWVFREASRMASPRVLRWLGDRVDDEDALRWFFGRTQNVLEALVLAKDPVGPLVANEVTETGFYRVGIFLQKYFDQRTAGGNITRCLFDLIPPDRGDLRRHVDPLFRRVWRRSESFSAGRFRDLLRNPVIAQSAANWVFALLEGGECIASFRPDGDELVTLDGELALPDRTTVMMASQKWVDRRTRRAWDLHLAEHEIAKPFAQW